MKKLDKEDLKDKKKGKYNAKEEKKEDMRPGTLGAIKKQLRAQGAMKKRGKRK